MAGGGGTSAGPRLYLRASVVDAFGDPAGVVVVDETGFPKQGTHSAGVARPYSGTPGTIGNCQVGVFLGYASPKGHVGLDRALYLPKAQTVFTALRASEAS
jgi:SRSO17 transposase